MKTYTIKSVRYNFPDSPKFYTGTLEHLVNEVFGYTLEVGASYAHEKGNKKINRNPKTGTSLVTNLNNAVSNSAANGCASKYYELVRT